METLGAIQFMSTILSKNKNTIYQMDTKRDTISNLKFISRIKKGDKILVKDMVIQPPGIITQLTRTFINPDNKENARFFIENTIRHAIELLKFNVKTDKLSDRSMCKHIVRDIRLACTNGIQNLKYTYKDDIMFCCNIDTLTEDIDAQLREYIELYPYLADDTPEEEE